MFLLGIGLASCSYSNSEWFAARESDRGEVVVVTCTEGLPADAEVWRVGESRVVGDVDDQLLWSASDGWTDSVEPELVELSTGIAWNADLAVGIHEHNANFAFVLDKELPSSEFVLLVDGRVVGVQDFAAECPAD